MKQQGLVQIYTGEGKGKTTAALGLALRAAGGGLKVFIAQFMKGVICSEHEAIKKFAGLILIKQYGTGRFIKDKPSDEDIAIAMKGLNEAKEKMLSGEYDIIILDEINTAASMGLINLEELLKFISEKPYNIELILTGRNAPQRLLDAADLITYMQAIRHYYDKGVAARKGIEY